MAIKKKSILQSKTFWLACLQAAVGIVVIVTTQYPELQTVGEIAILKSVLDMLLRMVTSDTVSVLDNN